MNQFDFPQVGTDERFDSYTITLGEWYEQGFYDPDDASWHWDAYSDEQYTRLCKKFLDRFYFRDVSVLPAYRWKLAYLRKLNEIMPKYKELYKRVENGINPLQIEDAYEKSRDIFSDFPQTLLDENADYASTGNDREFERVTEGDVVNRLIDYAERYNDVDVLILNELDSCLFSSIIVPTVPMF